MSMWFHFFHEETTAVQTHTDTHFNPHPKFHKTKTTSRELVATRTFWKHVHSYQSRRKFPQFLKSANGLLLVWGPVVWILRITLWKGLLRIKGTQFESQTTGPQATQMKTNKQTLVAAVLGMSIYVLPRDRDRGGPSFGTWNSHNFEGQPSGRAILY